MRAAIRAAIILVLASAVAHADEPTPTSNPATAPRVHHVPPAEAQPDAALVLEATVASAWTAPLELLYRRVGGPTAWKTVRFEQAGDGRWQATIPAADAVPPGIEYFVASGLGAHFASAADPWRVAIRRSAHERRVAAELERVHGRRFRVRVAGEYASFGDRPPMPLAAATADDFVRLDVDIQYRLLRYPLHALRFGYTQLRGPARPYAGCTEQCDKDAGFQPGGWTELRLEPFPQLFIDARVMAVAVNTGFNMGGRGELRLGQEDASHIAFGFEYVGDVGGSYWFRLGWDTVPRVPMAATIELSDLPELHRRTGVRLLYDVFYPLDAGLRVGVRAGYQARDQQIGGVSVGVNASLDF